MASTQPCPSIADPEIALADAPNAVEIRTKKGGYLNYRLSFDFVFILGVGLVFLGYFTHLLWWVFGGVLLIFMGLVPGLSSKDPEIGDIHPDDNEHDSKHRIS